MKLDHLAVTAADLQDGVRWTESRLGLPLAPGGRHPHFGTHNRLMRLGDGEYLEVIAPDPAAPDPGRPRWFDLDRAGAPALGNWIARVATPDLIPAESGDRLALARGDLRWQIGVPADGSRPGQGGLPTVIAWEAGVHPADRLPDVGARLVRLIIRHPQAGTLARPLSDPRIVYEAAATPSLSAIIMTPAGERRL